MKRIPLAATVVALSILIVVLLRPGGDDATSPVGEAATPARDGQSTALPTAKRLPEAPDDDLDGVEGERLELTPAQRRAMHRLVQTYQSAQQMNDEVEASKRLQAELETERYATDSEGIRAAIQSQIPAVKECYESWLGLNPKLQGRIVTNFAIEAYAEKDGAGVVGVNVRDGGLGNKFLEGCVLSVFSNLEFEAPETGRIEVNYPFTFRAVDSEEE